MMDEAIKALQELYASVKAADYVDQATQYGLLAGIRMSIKHLSGVLPAIPEEPVD